MSVDEIFDLTTKDTLKKKNDTPIFFRGVPDTGGGGSVAKIQGFSRVRSNLTGLVADQTRPAKILRHVDLTRPDPRGFESFLTQPDPTREF